MQILRTHAIAFFVKEVLSMGMVDEGDLISNAAEELWLKVVKDFDNETVHNAFIDYCTATRQLPLAGAKYKTYRDHKGNTPLIDACIKKIVLSAQVSYLPDGHKTRATQSGPFSRLFTALVFLMSGCIIVVLWIAYPNVRIVILISVAMVLVGGVYQLKRKL
jgi:hypothetical protein